MKVSTSHNPMGLHGLLQGYLYLAFSQYGHFSILFGGVYINLFIPLVNLHNFGSADSTIRRLMLCVSEWIYWCLTRWVWISYNFRRRDTYFLPYHHSTAWSGSNELHGSESFLRSHQLWSYSRISQHFIGPKLSLTCLNEPYTGAYSEPDQSSPHRPILSF
jgi:hypothetical protein